VNDLQYDLVAITLGVVLLLVLRRLEARRGRPYQTRLRYLPHILIVFGALEALSNLLE